MPNDIALDMQDLWRRYSQGQDLTDQEWSLLVAIVDDGMGLELAVLPDWYVNLIVAHLEKAK